VAVDCGAATGPGSGPIGISALFYATLAERRTGDPDIFPLVTLAITVSVVLHGLSSAPFSIWLSRRSPQASR